MYGQSHIRFNILLGWCCLLSVAVLVMAMVLATGINNKSPSNGMQQGSTGFINGLKCLVGPPYTNIRPEQDNETSWQQGQMCFCKNTSLLLKDNRVKITVGGFYYIYAQVSFKQVDKGTVTVIANENIPNKTPRKLIEAQQHSPGTVSMSGVILLKKGDSVKLAIWSLNKSMLLLKDESQTHWGLFLFARQQDY
uniref:THD domain-containing protein n=1 Tax=Pygocentrus nattereri TaxID=42514 RepID=A0AAR2K6B5_PYGNA